MGFLLAAAIHAVLLLEPSPAVAETTKIGPRLVIEPAIAEAGEIYWGSVVEATFVLRNDGDEPLEIRSVTAAIEGGSVELAATHVAPGSSTTARVKQPMVVRMGESGAVFPIVTNDPEQPRRRLRLAAFVQSAYDPESLDLDLGTVRRGAPIVAELELGSREIDRLEFQVAERFPGWIRFEEIGRTGVAGEGVRLRLTVAPDAPPGLHTLEGRLRTNLALQPTLPVRLAAFLADDVYPSEPGKLPVFLGVAEIGQPLETRVTLRSFSGLPFEIESAVVEGSDTQLTEVACAEVAPCRSFLLSALTLTERNLGGTLVISVRGQAPLRLPFGGLVAAPGKVERIDLTNPLEGLKP